MAGSRRRGTVVLGDWPRLAAGEAEPGPGEVARSPRAAERGPRGNYKTQKAPPSLLAVLRGSPPLPSVCLNGLRDCPVRRKWAIMGQ